MEKEQEKDVINNRKVKDNGAKLVFDDPVLCAQFLRGYVNIDLLKNVQPEDIEDISERFLPMWQEGRDSDSVKKIHLKELPLFVITIIEHQSKIHYDMSFKILRYIVMVLTEYETEQEKIHPGVTKTKDFKYPPILPIVYYEGSQNWNADKNFRDRTYLSNTLRKYIPDFEYLVVPLADYTNQELIEKKDELSLIMLINKLRSSSDFKNLKEIPLEYFEIERREFAMLFDSFETYDVQETRRISKAEGKAEAMLEILSEIGNIPEDLRNRILSETDMSTLNAWLKLSIKAESIEVFRENAGL